MKVYISSTYQDLVDHRAAVDRTLRRMSHDVIGMEQYIAEGSKPVDRCKADVRTADAYVIIVAWRYGYVQAPDGRSIPWRLHRGRRGRPPRLGPRAAKHWARKTAGRVFLLDIRFASVKCRTDKTRFF